MSSEVNQNIIEYVLILALICEFKHFRNDLV